MRGLLHLLPMLLHVLPVLLPPLRSCSPPPTCQPWVPGWGRALARRPASRRKPPRLHAAVKFMSMVAGPYPLHPVRTSLLTPPAVFGLPPPHYEK